MSTVYEQSDGFVPNKQTPPSTSTLGTSSAKWDQIHGTAVSGTTMGAATSIHIAGQKVPRIYTSGGTIGTGGTSVPHNLSNSNPVVLVYGSGTNEIYQLGSGAPGVTNYLVSVSGSDANHVVITSSASLPGSTIVVLG